MGDETRYHPSSERLALASTIEESLAAVLPRSRVHTEHDEDAAGWSSLDEIGTIGSGVSEEQAGSGLSAVDEALVVMALGRFLAVFSLPASSARAHAQAPPSAATIGGCAEVTTEMTVLYARMREQFASAIGTNINASIWPDSWRNGFSDEPGAPFHQTCAPAAPSPAVWKRPIDVSQTRK